MKPPIIVIALALGAAFLSPIAASGKTLDVGNPACEELYDEVGFGDDNADHHAKNCKPKSPENGSQKPFKTWTPKQVKPSENKKLKKPKYLVRDYDECFFGQENHSTCNVNPDVAPCPDGTLPITRQIHTTKRELVRQFLYCPGDPMPEDLPEELFVEQIQIDLEKFRSYPIRGSKIQSTPNKFSLRNGHTHFWASNEMQEFNSNLSGSDVRIKAIPIQWNWNYGDGATRNLNFPGEAMPSHTLREETKSSHSYTKTGKFGVRVTTLYRGEFSVDGGPWQAIPGQAAVPSNTLPMDVWRTKKELIAND